MIWKKVLVAWILAFIFATPQLFIFVQTNEGIKPDGSTRHFCKSRGYTAKWQRKVYFTFLTSYILIIPTCIMSYCYFSIIKVVWKRVEEKPEVPKLRIKFRSFRGGPSKSHLESDVIGNKHVTSHSTDNLPDICYDSRTGSTSNNKMGIPKKLISNSKRNVVKMTLSVVIGFLICWSPYFIVSLMRIYSNYRLKLKMGLIVAEVMALVHSALNPILYGIFSTKYTKIFCRHLCGRLCCHVDRADHFDNAVTEDDTTWREATKYTITVKTVDDNSNNPCVTCCASLSPIEYILTKCGCSKVLKKESRGIYHELVPNGNSKLRPRSSRNSDRELVSDQETNIEGLNEEAIHRRTPSCLRSNNRNSSSLRRSHRKRSTVSFVLTSPHSSSRENRTHCISSV